MNLGKVSKHKYWGSKYALYAYDDLCNASAEEYKNEWRNSRRKIQAKVLDEILGKKSMRNFFIRFQAKIQANQSRQKLQAKIFGNKIVGKNPW